MDAADNEALYHCVGICLPDEDGAYCIGCGRPLAPDQSAVLPVPNKGFPSVTSTFEEPDQRTSYSKLPPT